jgi:hypothetical protein
MFGLYFGNYLVEKNKISRSQYEDLMEKQQKTRVKLGLIAVAEKLLTAKQAEEINDIQRKLDKRFGDIAIEKGYLLPEEVTHLLNLQGNPYLQFVQVITENNILSIHEIETYLEEYKKDNNLKDSDIDALKSGDIDRIIPVFVETDIPLCGDCISLFLRNVVRFISTDMVISKIYKTGEYKFGALASQKMVGDHEFFVGFACQDKELLAIANPFAKEEFIEVDEDAFDSVCEFINCTNGLYASKLSHEDIHIDMTPPLFYTDKKILSKGDIYVVPINIGGKHTDLLVTIDSQLEIN